MNGLIPRRFPPLLLSFPAFLLAAFLSGCDRAPKSSTPLLQRAYLWQRTWDPAVAEAIHLAGEHLDGVIVLGAEIISTGKGIQIIRATVDWERLRASKIPVAMALRVAPFSGPFATEDAMAQTITATTESLLLEASAHGVKLSEFQLDFDCAQKKLAGFQIWLRSIRPVVQPLRLVITALPSWLNEPEFKAVLKEVDGYVLQVHSVPTSEKDHDKVLCDPEMARKWVAQAAKLGVPFSVALPTYRCLAGYNSAGQLVGVAMDSILPAWPRGTRLLNFAADSGQIAFLTRQWLTFHPPELRELLWYRLPVAGDARNWSWKTLLAVMAGRGPIHKMEALQEGTNPVDISISNRGEADAQGAMTVTASWSGASLLASDALPGWILQLEKDRATFTQNAAMRSPLPPSGKRSIGWLHYDKPTIVRLQVEELVEPDR